MIVKELIDELKKFDPNEVIYVGVCCQDTTVAEIVEYDDFHKGIYIR